MPSLLAEGELTDAITTEQDLLEEEAAEVIGRVFFYCHGALGDTMMAVMTVMTVMTVMAVMEDSSSSSLPSTNFPLPAALSLPDRKRMLDVYLRMAMESPSAELCYWSAHNLPVSTRADEH